MPQPERQRTLLMVASSAGFGGGERNLLDLALAMAERGWRVSVAVPAEGRLSALLDAAGIPWHVTPMGGSGVFQGISVLRRLYRWLKPDIVHAHGLRASLIARLAKPWTGVRLVYSLHGLHYLHYPSALKRAAFQAGERLLRPLADSFVCVSEADRADAVAAGLVVPARTVVIPNGTGRPSPAGRAAERGRLGLGRQCAVLSLTRLEYEKGADLLVDVAAEVIGAHPRARFLVAGEGSRRPEVEAAIATRGLGDAVRLLGFSQDTGELLAAADVFLSTSRWEGLPYTVLEAMSAGLPVVAPAVGGMAEAVEDGVSGVLVAVGDTGAFADALSRLCADPRLRARMGKAGHARWESAFTLDRMLQSFETLYEGLADREAIAR